MPAHTQIDTIMTRDVVTIAPDDTLMEIREILHKRGFRHLVVTKGGALVGVVSDRDVLKALSPFLDTGAERPRDVNTLVKPARQFMRSDPVTVGPEATVEEAGTILLERTISCLPVVEEDKVLGIVTTKDLLTSYVGTRSAKT